MAITLAFVLTITPLTMTVKDHGVHGHTFPIEEEDFLEYLKNKSQNFISQDFSEIGQKLQKHYKKSIVRPTPVKNLKEATFPTIHYFDPTIIAKQEIRDEEGNIVVAKGASYNPLQHFPLSEELLFFNGDDPSQLAWAKSLGEYKKWILVAGYPVELEEKENRPVYFDQNGLLTQKLKIIAIPAHISQEGNLLKIEIIPMQRKTCAS